MILVNDDISEWDERLELGVPAALSSTSNVKHSLHLACFTVPVPLECRGEYNEELGFTFEEYFPPVPFAEHLDEFNHCTKGNAALSKFEAYSHKKGFWNNDV